jgi:transitional endoplasmic reticulum ATPase
VGGRVPDIVFIAATNHPSTLDQAVLRGGRFTEKVEFAPPALEQIKAYAARWLAARNWGLDAQAGQRLSDLDGQSIANVTAVLQAAINSAVMKDLTPHSPGSLRLISAGDLAAGIAAVRSEFR